MFRTCIRTTPFSTDAAEAYFKNITGEPFANDISFVSTLRALVAPRIKDGEGISVTFYQSQYTASDIGQTPVGDVLRAICGDRPVRDATGQIIIHNFVGAQEDNIANFRVIKSEFCSTYSGYHRFDKVAAFYQKSFMVDCYINPDSRNVYLFVDNLDYKRLHYLQVAILAFLPWYFDPAKGVSEDEMNLLQSLRETSADKYNSCLAKLAGQYNFREAFIRKTLSGFESRYEQIEREKVRNNILAIDNDIDRLNEQIGTLLTKRNDSCVRLLGLEQKIAEGDTNSEIMDYFLCNRSLYLENVTQTYMYFCVKDYLTYFDRELAERAISNRRSYVYPYGEEEHRGITHDGMKKLMTELFVSEEPRLRIKVCAAYRFNLNGNVEAQSGHEFTCDFSDAMPNPHINRYSCMGNYTRSVNQLLASQDYIGALEQCVASCKSLNFGDSTVMSDFMMIMWGKTSYGNNCCIELPNGNIVKPIDAIKWLEQQEGATDEQKEEEA